MDEDDTSADRARLAGYAVTRGTSRGPVRPRVAGSPMRGPARMSLDSPVAATDDLRAKGLSTNSVGLLASIVLGISSIAPVYALTVTLGPTVTEVGLQMPAIFLAGFLPMLLVAYAYRELNRVAPRSEEHTSELQSRQYLVCRLLLEKKKQFNDTNRN